LGLKTRINRERKRLYTVRNIYRDRNKTRNKVESSLNLLKRSIKLMLLLLLKKPLLRVIMIYQKSISASRKSLDLKT
jgi:hypothetical protein